MTQSEDDKKPKYEIKFAPGAFDNFEGNQEELDELIAEITAMAESGELLEQSEVVNFDDLTEEDMEMLEAIDAMLDGLDNGDSDEITFESEERKKKLN